MTELKPFKCYKGLAFRVNTSLDEDLAVFANDLGTLRRIWDLIAPEKQLDETKCQAVVILSAEMFNPQP